MARWPRSRLDEPRRAEAAYVAGDRRVADELADKAKCDRGVLSHGCEEYGERVGQ